MEITLILGGKEKATDVPGVRCHTLPLKDERSELRPVSLHQVSLTWFFLCNVCKTTYRTYLLVYFRVKVKHSTKSKWEKEAELCKKGWTAIRCNFLLRTKDELHSGRDTKNQDKIYVGMCLSCLSKMPFTPVSPSGPPAPRGLLSLHPYFQRQEAKISADEQDSACEESRRRRTLRHAAVLRLGAVRQVPPRISTITPGVRWPPACCKRAPSLLGFIGCFGKCQLLAPKGLIWRSSLMKEKNEVCIHVPFQWEMLEFGDMSIYRKRKAGGVLFLFFSLMA